jgi:hypothetical protein
VAYLLAGATLATIPMIVLFLVAQRRFVKAWLRRTQTNRWLSQEGHRPLEGQCRYCNCRPSLSAMIRTAASAGSIVAGARPASMSAARPDRENSKTLR